MISVSKATGSRHGGRTVTPRGLEQSTASYHSNRKKHLTYYRVCDKIKAQQRKEADRKIAKRKTHTSTEVKQRWIKANYQRYNVNLRYDTDKPLIDLVEGRKARGETTTEVFREALERLLDEDG